MLLTVKVCSHNKFVEHSHSLILCCLLNKCLTKDKTSVLQKCLQKMKALSTKLYDKTNDRTQHLIFL